MITKIRNIGQNVVDGVIYPNNNKSGNGGADEFWVYTRSSGNDDVNKGEIFNYNTEKYPEDYEEYFDPQYPGDSDKYCNPKPRKDLGLNYYGKKQQSWIIEFNKLF